MRGLPLRGSMRLGSSRAPTAIVPCRCTESRTKHSTLGRGALAGNPLRVVKMMMSMFLLPALLVLTRARAASRDKMVRQSAAAWPVSSKRLTGFFAAFAALSMD